MSNVTVQEALKVAEKLIVKAIMFESEAEQYLSESNYELNGCLGDCAADISVNGKAVLAKVRAALSDIEKCEPVAHLKFISRQWLVSPEIGMDGFEGLEVCDKDDKGDDGSDAIAVYTSPQPRDWVELSDNFIAETIWENTKLNPNIKDDAETLLYVTNAVKAILAESKQLNTKG